MAENMKISFYIISSIIFMRLNAHGRIHEPGNPPPRTPVDDWNDFISTNTMLGLLAVALLTIMWIFSWGIRMNRKQKWHG